MPKKIIISMSVTYVMHIHLHEQEEKCNKRHFLSVIASWLLG